MIFEQLCEQLSVVNSSADSPSTRVVLAWAPTARLIRGNTPLNSDPIAIGVSIVGADPRKRGRPIDEFDPIAIGVVSKRESSHVAVGRPCEQPITVNSLALRPKGRWTLC